jgi:hypothetical protein
MPRADEPADAPMKPVIDEPPPFLGAWPRVYAFVLAVLAAVIVLLFLFARAFAP